MADKTIGELPAVSQVTSGTLIPVEQSGVAGRMNGAQFQDWAVSGVSPYVSQVQQSANAAATSATNAGLSATAAEDAADLAEASANSAEEARQAIEDMGVTSTTLDPGATPTVTKIVDQQGAVTLRFGLAPGAVGPQGATGPTGATGAQGPAGRDGSTPVVVPGDGQYAFHVDENGHLICTYVGDTAPDFEINANGHLILNL